MKREKNIGWSSQIVYGAVRDTFLKLNPFTLIKNPVMLLVEIESLLTTVVFISELYSGKNASFSGQITAWLWFTVLFANFAEALAEGRGKAQAETLKKSRSDTLTKLRIPDGSIKEVLSSSLRKGDIVIVNAGETIPADGTVIEGAASVNESAITGESAPVIREAGGDRSAVTGGTTVLSDTIVIQISTSPGESFLDRMINLVEGAERQKTPNEIALNILLSGMTLIFILAVVTLKAFTLYSHISVSLVILISLLVCLIPTTIGGLLSAIGIAGMDRLICRNVMALSGRAVEAAGDVDVLILDKTGTITLGNRMATEFLPVSEATQMELAEAAFLSSSTDLTPEGRSIVTLAQKMGINISPPADAICIPFTAETRMSGIDYNKNSIRKGAVDSIQSLLQKPHSELKNLSDKIAKTGGTPLAVVSNGKALGIIHLKDIVKPGMPDRLASLRQMGIKTIMVTGDNRLTAEAIAREAGVDDFLAEAKPEDKLTLIRDYQKKGRMIAMSGDGTNDAPALAQADVGLVMNTGTQAAREAGNMIDLDSDPTKLIEIVGIGKQLLITRGALTTFSISNDVSKYFAILPALFASTFPSLNALNIMRLATPQSAVLSAVIFNAIIIILLIPLALRGVKYRATTAASLLKRNFLIYGIGGLLIPFAGIKVVDIILNFFHLI